MAITPAQPQQTPGLGPWSGMNNCLPAHSLPPDKLRNAVNVLIDATGRVRTRPGLEEDYAGSGCHSFFACPLGRFFVEGGVLKQHTGGAATALRNVAGPVAYEYVNGEVYCTDGAQIWKIDASLAVAAWGDAASTGEADFTNSTFDIYPEVYSPPPPGSILRYHFGRIYIVDADDPRIVWFTEPYAFGRVKLQKGYLGFESPVRIFESVSDGIWCATDECTWWLAGTDPSEFAQQLMTVNPQLNYGGVARSSVKVPFDNDVMWMSPYGAVRAAPGGQIKALHENDVAVSPAAVGASLILEADGNNHFISTIIPTGPSVFANKDWVTEETERRA